MDALSGIFQFLIIVSYFLAAGVGALLTRPFRTFLKGKLSGEGHVAHVKVEEYKDLLYQVKKLERLERAIISGKISEGSSDAARDLIRKLSRLIGEDIEQVKEPVFQATDLDSLVLHRIPLKEKFRIKANFEIVGRRKPMNYDFADFEEETYCDD